MEEEKISATILLYGEIDEETTPDVLTGLLQLEDDPDFPVGSEINIYICTPGGCAYNMFAIYDTIRRLNNQGYLVITHATGRAMSAGSLLLAAGVKGKRTIGKNARVMIHSISGENVGFVSALQSDLSEIKSIQEQFVGALVSESKLSSRQLKRMIGRNVNVYFSAEEAVKFGIADLIT